jgi:hypothetical protein
MTPTTLVKWAEEVGLSTVSMGDLLAFEKLCRLAREDMREQCAKVCEMLPFNDNHDDAMQVCAHVIRNLEV